MLPEIPQKPAVSLAQVSHMPAHRDARGVDHRHCIAHHIDELHEPITYFDHFVHELPSRVFTSQVEHTRTDLMNKIILIGRLGRDAEVRGASDRPIVAFSIAVTTTMAGGEKDTQWFTCSAFGTLAKFLAGVQPKKGTLVSVEGKMKKRTFTDRNGVEKNDMEVIVEHFQFLERKGDGESIGGGTGAYVEEPARAPHDIWR